MYNPARRMLRTPAPALAMITGAVLASACHMQPPPGVPAPQPAVSHPLTEVESAAFAELLHLEDSRTYASDRLSRLATSGSGVIRARTAVALGRLGNPESLPLLFQLLQDTDTAVAARSAFALGQLADSTAVPILAAQLQLPRVEERPSVAAEAAYALGKLRSETADGALQRFLSTAPPRADVREVVQPALLAAWRFPRPPDLSPLLRWTASPDPEVRWSATYALVRRTDARAAPILSDLARDPDPSVRAIAIRGLTAALVDSASLRPEPFVQTLLGATADPDYTVRINAIRSLGSFAGESAAETLRPLLESSDHHARVTAIESLGRIGAAAGSSAPRLGAIARSEDLHVYLRQAALEALALIDSARAGAVAMDLRNQPEWRLRLASARAFARSAPLGPEQRALIGDPDGRVAAGALGASLAALGDSVAPMRTILLERLSAPDPIVRATALEGLATLRDPSSLLALLDAYESATHDADNDAALAALGALAALRSDQLDPARSLFARFSRPADRLVRLRADSLFGPSARAAWGPVGPAETTHSPEVYRMLVERWASSAAPTSRPEVEIVTNRGAVRVKLFGDLAPLIVYNFLGLAARGYFDGQEWPRVVPNFVVQGGDPRGDMSGGPGYAIRDELNPARYAAGSVGMALSGPDTGGSQFFLTHSAQPHLDGIYTVFGAVTSGQAILEQLLPGDRIVSVRALP